MMFCITQFIQMGTLAMKENDDDKEKFIEDSHDKDNAIDINIQLHRSDQNIQENIERRVTDPLVVKQENADDEQQKIQKNSVND